jgi:hypothetical protein
MEEARQGLKHGIEGSRITTEMAAGEARALTITSGGADLKRQLAVRRPIVNLEGRRHRVSDTQVRPHRRQKRKYDPNNVFRVNQNIKP